MTCRLCESSEVGQVSEFAVAHGRTYWRCARCKLTFVDSAYLPTPSEEKSRYARHQNDPADPDYRRFLSRLADPLIPKLRPGSRGLDYGSGPGPTLSVMLEEHGFRMSIYDPFFAPDSVALDSTYDFVTCTETVEHFHHPAREFSRLVDLLNPGGWLAIMTEMLQPDEDFEDWWYIRDPTHVSFYQSETMEWFGKERGLTVEFPARNVVLFQKPASMRN